MNRFVRNPRLVQYRAELRAHSRLVPFPKRTKWVFGWIAHLGSRPSLFISKEGRQRRPAISRCCDQIDLAIRARRVSLPVLRSTFWTNHAASLHHVVPKDCPARYRALSMRIRREPITQTVNGLKTPGADPIARLPLSRPTHLRHRPLFSVVCGQRPELPPTTSLQNVLANGTSPLSAASFAASPPYTN